MSIELKRRRGTTAEHATFTGAEGELTVDTTKKTVVVHDGITIGGHPLAKESEVPKSLISDYFMEVSASHSGLDFAYKAGKVRNDNVVTSVVAGTVTLTDDATNYIEVTGTGVVSANTTGYTTGKIPLFTVVTSSGAISTITDDRSFLNVGRGGDSGTGAFFLELSCLPLFTYDDLVIPITNTGIIL